MRVRRPPDLSSGEQDNRTQGTADSHSEFSYQSKLNHKGHIA